MVEFFFPHRRLLTTSARAFAFSVCLRKACPSPLLLDAPSIKPGRSATRTQKINNIFHFLASAAGAIRLRCPKFKSLQVDFQCQNTYLLLKTIAVSIFGRDFVHEKRKRKQINALDYNKVSTVKTVKTKQIKSSSVVICYIEITNFNSRRTKQNNPIQMFAIHVGFLSNGAGFQLSVLKPKPITFITLANHKRHVQSGQPIKSLNWFWSCF